MEKENYTINGLFRFTVSISDKCYPCKPGHNEYMAMSFHKQEVTPEELLDIISAGHTICHVFKGTRRKKTDFLYTSAIFIDVDDSTISMADFLKDCRMQPTIAYTTHSNGQEGFGYRFRLIYIFKNKIYTEEEYIKCYNYIVKQINLENTKDKCGSVCNQLMNGNSNPNIEKYCSNYIYMLPSIDKNEFLSNSFLESIQLSTTIQDICKGGFEKIKSELKNRYTM